MSSFNEKIKNIPVIQFLIVIILLYVIWYVVNRFLIPVSGNVVYVFLIFYFIFKLRNDFSDFKSDFFNMFSDISLGYVVLIVVLNVFFSYGMLYLSGFLLDNFSFVGHIFNLGASSKSLLGGVASVIGIVVISPISEELIFRGVIYNKLKIIVPVSFAVVISSLFFAMLHPYGSIISAFVFALCMLLIYCKTENITVVIFAHFLNNLIAESISHIDSANILFTDALLVDAVSVMAVISAVIIIFLIHREWNTFK